VFQFVLALLEGHGLLRGQPTPALLLRIVGAPPIVATGYQLERLHCDTCGAVLTAPAPPEAGTQKYDPAWGRRWPSCVTAPACRITVSGGAKLGEKRRFEIPVAAVRKSTVLGSPHGSI
jgi:hypothetical protein